jgi:hypothetical protein
MLQPAGLRIANINIDGWQNLPHIRFREANPAQHFYLNAIRFDEMSNRLIFPLLIGVRCASKSTLEETAIEYRRQTYQFQDIDIIPVGRNLSIEARFSKLL